MAIVATLKKTVTDVTPLYAAVGVTDLAVEKVREARADAFARRTKLVEQATKARQEFKLSELTEYAQAVPNTAVSRGLTYATQAQESYEGLALRGSDLVTRVREQQATKDLFTQAETTLALGKGAVTSFRNAASDIERSAKATLTVGRREVAEAADDIADSVTDEVTEAVKDTKTAAKKTTTTAKKRTSTAASKSKAASTSARKTATKSTTATKKAAAKVGD